jgi:hypothetical protein
METCFDDLDAPMGRVAGAEVPTPYAANLEAMVRVAVCSPRDGGERPALRSRWTPRPEGKLTHTHTRTLGLLLLFGCCCLQVFPQKKEIIAAIKRTLGRA